MRFYRSFAITKRIFAELRNDKRTIALIVIAPIFAMFVFGLAFSGDVKDIHVIVVNKDEGFAASMGITISISDKIISNFDREVLDIEYMDSMEKAINKVENGKAYAVIIFPKHFTKNVYMKMENSSFSGNTTIKIMVDKSNINVANAIIKNVGDALLKTMKESGYEVPIAFAEDAIYGKNAEFMDFFVPGIMAFVVYLLTTLLTLISFVGERTSGTLNRILATPLKESEIVIGYATAFSIIGTTQSALLLTIGIIVFNITIIGNLMLAFAVIALLAIVCQSLGILLSSLAKREAQAVQFLPFIVLPAFLLAGIFWPIEAIPSWLRPASYFIPPTYAVHACRSVMLKGWGIDKIWMDIAALLLFASLFLIMAVRSLKRKEAV
ncbi:MAG: ABC transporter permease [Thermoplasmata archaeon]|nr:MAG: ABC transporter permease [Thermoplasmata archaeon]